ncbi:hypothetical protein B0H17DRAFT_1196963 [Mycena rosella]|uniref:Uncharacterized protein n=1 Tax=Mycena rosella TaxID=1033263 RepID=A0AAD7GP55_MYCRO|nr:hypothetical protein B0H17DRAFT_1196963 [Mycena rosella]
MSHRNRDSDYYVQHHRQHHQQDNQLRSNAYWPALLGYSSTDIDKAFADIAGSGATTVR